MAIPCTGVIRAPAGGTTHVERACPRRQPAAMPLGAFLLAGALAFGQVLAQSSSAPPSGDPSRPPDAAPAQSGGASSEPPPPPGVTSADLLQSAREEVRIMARENHTVQEYSVNGNVYKLKVTPKGAPPYYLYDEDGSGNFQWKRGPGLERTEVPHWAVFKW